MVYWSFWGMNVLWWGFWALMLLVFFAALTPVPRSRIRLYEDPYSILRRRYALGELTTAEYDERRDVLMRTSDDKKARAEATRPAISGTTPAHSKA
jgi:uncharacterized membrane protein